jgi:formate dehydrogenase major subunit
MADWEVDPSAVPTPWAIRCTTRIRREIMDEIARLTPTFTGVSYARARPARQRSSGRATTTAPEGTPIMHVDRLRARQGSVHDHRIRADRREGWARASRCCSPPAASSAQYNVGAQTRRTANVALARRRTCSRSIPTTPRSAASRDGEWVRRGQSRCRRDRAAGPDHRAGAAGRGLHHLPPPADPGQRRSPPTTPTGPPTAPSTR